MNKTTKADFKYFKMRCEYYIKLWKLIEWHVTYKHANNHPNDRAGCTRSTLAMRATIDLSINWEYDKITKKALNRVAKHEVLHILLAPLECLTQARFITEDEYKNGSHTVVQKLINLLED